MKFTILIILTLQERLAHSQCCATIASSSRTFSSFGKETPGPVKWPRPRPQPRGTQALCGCTCSGRVIDTGSHTRPFGSGSSPVAYWVGGPRRSPGQRAVPFYVRMLSHGPDVTCSVRPLIRGQASGQVPHFDSCEACHDEHSCASFCSEVLMTFDRQSRSARLHVF